MRKASRDRPSRKSPAIASRGAKPMRVHEAVELRPGSGRARSNSASIWASSPTSQSKTSSEPNSARELGDALAEALAHVAEGQFGALAVAGAGDAVGDRAVRQHPGDEQASCRREIPWLLRWWLDGGAGAPARRGRILAWRPAGRPGAAWHAGACPGPRPQVTMRFSLDTLHGRILPAHFFWLIAFRTVSCPAEHRPGRSRANCDEGGRRIWQRRTGTRRSSARSPAWATSWWTWSARPPACCASPSTASRGAATPPARPNS